MNRRSLSGSAENVGSVSAAKWAWLVLRALGSLKITVSMFALGTLILFVGTLAQDEETIVDVKKQYFNSWIATVPIDVFMPQTIWPHTEISQFAFAIPGGMAIGWILFVNLIAAKLTRFQMNAKGGRLIAGAILSLLGFALVLLIVFTAHRGDGLQGEPPYPITYDLLWTAIKTSVFLLAGSGIAWSIGWTPKTKVVRWTVWSLTAILIGLSVTLLAYNDACRISNPGLRIVWQLTKSLGVSLVMLSGLLLLFGKRGGNVLIHLGVALLMVGQFRFGDAQREERITIFEGQSTMVAYEQETVELAFIDSSDPSKNHVVAFEHPMLMQSNAKGTFLSSPELPVEFRVDKWMVNSKRKERTSVPQKGDDDFEVQGVSKDWKFEEAARSGGAKSSVNFATAFITLRNKSDKEPMGKYVVSQLLNDDALMYKPEYEQLEKDGKKWDFGLRFRRNYKPYSVLLDDVVLQQYTGTLKPKDYSSYIKVKDQDGSVLQECRVWMNNPMRFRGETFYQSGYMSKDNNPYGVEQTTLQVVTNAGWLIPYVACVMAGLGMLVHFGGTFAKFASRYDRKAFAPRSESNAASEIASPLAQESLSKSKSSKSKLPSRNSMTIGIPQSSGSRIMRIALPIVVCGIFGIWIGSRTMTPKVETEAINWYAIGEIPTQFGGRIKPLSSASSEVLEILSGKKVALTGEGLAYEPVHENGKSVDSLKWIMDVFVKEPWVFDAPLFKIDAVETTTSLDLRRHKSHRYSYNQVNDGIRKIAPQIQTIFKTKREEWTFEQEKLADVIEKLFTFENLLDAYTPIAPKINDDPAVMLASIRNLQREADGVRSRSPLAIIPPVVEPEVAPGATPPPPKWDGFGPALFEVVKARTLGTDAKKESVLAFMALTDTYGEKTKNPTSINKRVREFKEQVQREFGSTIKTNKVGFETWYEHTNPIMISMVMYVFVGLCAMLSFAFLRNALRSTSFWLCVISLVVHTAAIVSRIYITERPPVITLYSAAVFIGWGMVLFCTITELLFPISISVLVASVAGFLTLLVASAINVGDSMPELEAVLDTRFWLATHVTSVSLGYSATFIAGLIGIGIIVSHWVVSLAGPKTQIGLSTSASLETLYRICYGVTCFGLFFSFVGTVLGGLWGDDSWGRFWGWDPKENGAMMIVLWNALLLHARWDKMVRALGFAILAVFGNIITAWSMFGTNLLGVGLHSYGFNRETFYYLVYFVVSQLIVILLGIIVVAIVRSNKALELE